MVNWMPRLKAYYNAEAVICTEESGLPLRVSSIKSDRARLSASSLLAACKKFRYATAPNSRGIWNWDQGSMNIPSRRARVCGAAVGRDNLKNSSCLPDPTEKSKEEEKSFDREVKPLHTSQPTEVPSIVYCYPRGGGASCGLIFRVRASYTKSLK